MAFRVLLKGTSVHERAGIEPAIFQRSTVTPNANMHRHLQLLQDQLHRNNSESVSLFLKPLFKISHSSVNLLMQVKGQSAAGAADPLQAASPAAAVTTTRGQNSFLKHKIISIKCCSQQGYHGDRTRPGTVISDFKRQFVSLLSAARAPLGRRRLTPPPGRVWRCTASGRSPGTGCRRAHGPR